MTYTIEQFAGEQNVSARYIQQLIKEGSFHDKFSEEFKIKEINKKRRLIVKEKITEDEPIYKHASKLSAETKVKIENALNDSNYINSKGKPVIAKIAKLVNEHYWTVKRYIEGDYKKKDEARSDKGISRKFSKKELKYLKDRFLIFYLMNAQKNVQQAKWKVKMGDGVELPSRLAYEWAASVGGSHSMKHYYKSFIANYTPHIRRDNWLETENFLDVVISDVWKIDDPFVPEDIKKKIDEELAQLKIKDKKKWIRQRTKADTAEALTFIDQKTAYPLTVIICPHSVSGSDVKKGMMRLITEWGLPKQWYLDNGREFINDETVQFLYGIYSGEMNFTPGAVNQKITILKEEESLQNSGRYQPYGKGRMERQYRIWKDEHCAYSPSYSPNQKESRKPGLELSSVQPTKDFNELAGELREFVYGEFINKPRPDMFMHPGYTAAHEINQDRPQSIKEAFDIAYSTYEKTTVDKFLLAFHYAEKQKATFKKGAVQFTYKTVKLQYIPTVEGFEAMTEYSYKKNAITVLMDPENIFHCWFFDGKKLLCEARDIRYEKDLGIGRDRAAHIQKLQNAAKRAERRVKTKIEEKNIVMPKYVVESDIEDIIPQSINEDSSNTIDIDVLGNLIETNTTNANDDFYDDDDDEYTKSPLERGFRGVSKDEEEEDFDITQTFQSEEEEDNFWD